jgi:hypothetical protein
MGATSLEALVEGLSIEHPHLRDVLPTNPKKYSFLVDLKVKGQEEGKRKKLESIAENSDLLFNLDIVGNPCYLLYRGDDWEEDVELLIQNSSNLSSLDYVGRDMVRIIKSDEAKEKIGYVLENQRRLSKIGITSYDVTNVFDSVDWKNDMGFLEENLEKIGGLNYTISFASRILGRLEGRKRLEFLLKNKIKPNHLRFPLIKIERFILNKDGMNSEKQKMFLEEYKGANSIIDLNDLVSKLKKEYNSFAQIFPEGDTNLEYMLDWKKNETILRYAEKFRSIAEYSDRLIEYGFNSRDCRGLFKEVGWKESVPLILDNWERLEDLGYTPRLISDVGGSTNGAEKVKYIMNNSNDISELNLAPNFVSNLLIRNKGLGRLKFLLKNKIKPDRSRFPLHRIEDFILNDNWWEWHNQRNFLAEYDKDSELVDLNDLVIKLRKEYNSFDEIFPEGDTKLKKILATKKYDSRKIWIKRLDAIAKNGEKLTSYGFNSYNCYKLIRASCWEESLQLVLDNWDKLNNLGYSPSFVSDLANSLNGSDKIIYLIQNGNVLSDLEFKEIKKRVDEIDWSEKEIEKTSDFILAHPEKCNLGRGHVGFLAEFFVKHSDMVNRLDLYKMARSNNAREGFHILKTYEDLCKLDRIVSFGFVEEKGVRKARKYQESLGEFIREGKYLAA